MRFQMSLELQEISDVTHLKISSQLYTNFKRGSKLTNKGVILDKERIKKWPFISQFWPVVKGQYYQNDPFIGQFWPSFGVGV